MTARNLLNTGLALLLISLVSLIVFDPGKDPVKEKFLLTELAPVNISSVVIDRPNQDPIKLKKINDQWHMIEPYNHQANNELIKKLLSVSQSISHTQYIENNINAEQLKLSNADLTIIFNNIKLHFGTTDALNGRRYILINDTVHLITDKYSYLVRDQATTLLSPTLLPNNTYISKLILPEFRISKVDKGWELEPDNKSVSTDQIQQLIDNWKLARALRVSNLEPNINNQKHRIIELYLDNEIIHFGLILTDDETILLRPDIGLSYHFAKEMGERLLKFSLASTQSKQSE